MDSLIQDALDLLRETAKTTPSVLATAEEAAYFAPVTLKKELPKLQMTSLPPIPPQKKTAPPPALVVQVDAPPQPIKPPLIEKTPLHDLRKAIQTTLPHLPLRDTIPDDTVAQKMSKLWEASYLAAQVVIIGFGEVGPGIEFLKHVTAAIDKLIASAHFIEGSSLEKERGWDLLLNSPSLKAVICSPLSSWKTTSLSKYYRQNGSSGEQFLGSHRLLLLEPSLIYLKHPDRKRELWKILNTQLLS